MEIKRACRIGRYNPQYSRPLSVEFKYHLDTDYIMENRGYLNEGVYVDREYTDEIERKRKMLLPILTTARHLKDYKKKCKLRGKYINHSRSKIHTQQLGATTRPTECLQMHK